MALVAQFLGEEAVAQMTTLQIERTADLLHASMLKAALSDKELKSSLTDMAGKVSKLAGHVKQLPN
jgi:hypothetical protein